MEIQLSDIEPEKSRKLDCHPRYQWIYISAIFLLLSVNEIFTHIQAATENLLICSMIEHGFASLASLYNTIDELTYYLLTYQVQVQFS